MKQFKLYDVIRLNKDFSTEIILPDKSVKIVNIPKNTIGVIVDIFSNQKYLIEFNAENLDYYVVDYSDIILDNTNNKI